MHRSTILALSLVVLMGTTAGLPAMAAQTGPITDAGQPYDKARAATTESPERTDQLRVGVGQATLAFRAGAAPGQVGTGFGTSLDEGPYPYTTVSEPGDGWHSEPMAKAFVVEKPDGERIAFVKTDLYLMQHSMHKRVADLVVDETGIDRTHLFLQGNHDHSHPYANSPSWGLCLFTDCFDLRQWSYMTRQIASAITEATDDLQPAEISAARGSLSSVQRNVIGPACATTMANGTGPQRALAIDQTHSELEHPREDHCVKAGFPREHFNDDFAVVRFDQPDGEPIGAMLSLGMHPESLDDGHGLTSADYAGMVEAKLQDHVRESSGNADFVAGWFVGALGDVEPASADQPDKKDWWRETFARTEDMVERMMPQTTRLFNAAGSTGKAGGDTVLDTDIDPATVDIATVQLPSPQDQPWGPDNSYITEQAGWGAKVPSTRGGQETTSAWLTVVRMGEVLIAGFPGEPITDLALNYETRVDGEADNVYQGYEWPDAPTWVRERIRDNFAEDELAPADGYEIPLMFSMTSDWTGYYVTAWEYDNRNHYRESMTPYGAEGAEHVVGTLVEMAGELAGGDEVDPRLSASRAADDAALDTQYAAMVAAEQSVRAYRASIPPNQGDVGAPTDQPDDVARFELAEFTWVGGSNAVDLPRVTLEERTDKGWTPVADSRDHEIVVRMEDAPVYEDPEQANPARDWTWTATYEVPWNEDPGTAYRFAVEGEYRSDTTSLADASFFDPLGADQPYQVTSEAFTVTGPGPIPVTEADAGGSTVTLTFEPYYRNNADPQVGTKIDATLVPTDGGAPVDATMTYTGHGLFVLDKTNYPAGDYHLEMEEGAWTDPAGNPSQAVELVTTIG